MKKIALLILSLSFFNPQVIKAQGEIDEIIQRNIKARGGQRLLTNLSSLEMEMTMENKMGEITSRTYTINNQASKMEMDIMGTVNYFLITQEGGWRFFPIQGMKKVQQVPEEQYMQMKSQLDINGELFNYHEKEKMIEFAGQEQVDEEMCFVLIVTDPNRPESPKKIYIAESNFQILQEVIEVEGPEGMQTMVTKYSDYEATKEGYVFARTIESPQGTAKIKKIIVNGEINPEKFEITQSDQEPIQEDHDGHEGHNH